MSVIIEDVIIKRVNLWDYNPEYNKDGTEKHIYCDGARFHVLHWDSNGEHCSEPNCEINKRKKGTPNDR